MKRHHKFWAIIVILAVIAFNVYWYYYETKLYHNAKFGDNSPYTILVGIYAVMFDFILLALFLAHAIPRFNKWIDEL